jgi:hypothetical protein
MRTDVRSVLLVGGVLLAAVGCATHEEWTTWREHPTHFASTEHMGFSLRNGKMSTPNVTRADIAAARHEGWWGKPVTVAQEQILER